MRSGMIWAGTVATVALVVLCLWDWQHAAELATGAQNPYVAKWAVRCAALAAGAAAQGVLLVFVIGRIYSRQLIDDILRLSAALVFTLAFVSAIALALAGR